MLSACKYCTCRRCCSVLKAQISLCSSDALWEVYLIKGEYIFKSRLEKFWERMRTRMVRVLLQHCQERPYKPHHAVIFPTRWKIHPMWDQEFMWEFESIAQGKTRLAGFKAVGVTVWISAFRVLWVPQFYSLLGSIPSSATDFLSDLGQVLGPLFLRFPSWAW